MNVWNKDFKLLGDHCLVNIASKEETKGLTVLSSDPRKWRIKPDAYVGTVEEVGTRCSLVQPGDKVVIERWEYKQFNVDDERIIGNASQIMIVNEKPAPGVVVMHLVNQLPKTNLVLPENVIKREKKKSLLYCGRVLASASKTVSPGDVAWVERRERHQYQMADGRFVFINVQDSWGEFPIWMKGTPVETEAVK